MREALPQRRLVVHVEAFRGGGPAWRRCRKAPWITWFDPSPAWTAGRTQGPRSATP